MNSQTNPIVTALIAGAIGVLGIVAHQFEVERARKMLYRQASLQGINLLDARYLPLGGPYWWHKGKGQMAFAIQRRTHTGQLQEGHAICGSKLLGLWVDEVSFDF